MFRLSRVLLVGICFLIIPLSVSAENFRDLLAKSKVTYCQGGRFKPCVCSGDVPKSVSYKPSEAACNGNAAVILRGKYLNVFSVVVRDSENRDRWPAKGFGGCSAFERDVLALNRCSAFKAQKVFFREGTNGKKERVSCLGAPGTSELFKKVRRITAKISDLPNSTNDPLARWCLIKPDVPLN